MAFLRIKRKLVHVGIAGEGGHRHSFWPYAPPLFDYIRRAMPADAPFSLGNDAVYALTAYLLHLNGLVGEAVVVDADHLSRIQMPNREGFIPRQERAAVR